MTKLKWYLASFALIAITFPPTGWILAKTNNIEIKGVPHEIVLRIDENVSNSVLGANNTIVAASPYRPKWEYPPHKAGWIPPDELIPKILDDLIQCESQGVNVKRLDTNDKYSYGCLQFQKETWDAWSADSGIIGDPMNRADALKMATWAIKQGYLWHWSCAYLLGILIK